LPETHCASVFPRVGCAWRVKRKAVTSEPRLAWLADGENRTRRNAGVDSIPTAPQDIQCGTRRERM
jgi:hypothetical protein